MSRKFSWHNDHTDAEARQVVRHHHSIQRASLAPTARVLAQRRRERREANGDGVGSHGVTIISSLARVEPKAMPALAVEKNKSCFCSALPLVKVAQNGEDFLTTDFKDITDGKAVFFIREICEIRGHLSLVAAGRATTSASLRELVLPSFSRDSSAGVIPLLKQIHKKYQE
jgi:hypothetical protein